MKAIQQMQAGKIYLIESTASANSVYFETDDLSKLFFRYCDYYLKDYLHVEEYVLNKNGWAMLIKVKSGQTIRKYYEAVEAARKSKVEHSKHKKPKAIWRILSERVRLFISTYVKLSNHRLEREGTLVRRNYGRYEFEDLDAAKQYVSKIRNDQHEMQQSNKKYRGFAEHFRMNGNLIANPLRSSLWVEFCEVKERVQEELVKIFGDKLPVLQGLGNLVGPKFKIDNSDPKQAPQKPPKP